MKAKLQIDSTYLNIPLYIKILEWLQSCPVSELEITVSEMWLNKENKKEEKK